MQKRSQKQPCLSKTYNEDIQYYKDVPIRLIVYTEAHFARLKAKRFMLGTKGNQNVWIPNVFLQEDGTIQPWANLDFIFKKAYRDNKFSYADIKINPLEWR